MNAYGPTGVVKLSDRYESRISALPPVADEVRAALDVQHVVDALDPLAAHVDLVLAGDLLDEVEVPAWTIVSRASRRM
jgi:hypothetical protein